MYLETIDEKAFRSFLSNPNISVLDGNVLDMVLSTTPTAMALMGTHLAASFWNFTMKRLRPS